MTVRDKFQTGLTLLKNWVDDLSDPVFFKGKGIAQLIKATLGITA